MITSSVQQPPDIYDRTLQLRDRTLALEICRPPTDSSYSSSTNSEYLDSSQCLHTQDDGKAWYLRKSTRIDILTTECGPFPTGVNVGLNLFADYGLDNVHPSYLTISIAMNGRRKFSPIARLSIWSACSSGSLSGKASGLVHLLLDYVNVDCEHVHVLRQSCSEVASASIDDRTSTTRQTSSTDVVVARFASVPLPTPGRSRCVYEESFGR